MWLSKVQYLGHDVRRRFLVCLITFKDLRYEDFSCVVHTQNEFYRLCSMEQFPFLGALRFSSAIYEVFVCQCDLWNRVNAGVDDSNSNRSVDIFVFSDTLRCLQNTSNAMPFIEPSFRRDKPLPRSVPQSPSFLLRI